VDDVLSWCVLALASSFAQSNTALQGLYTCLGAVAFVVVMLFVVRPLLGLLHRRLLAKQQIDNRYYLCLVMLLLIAAAFATQGLGIHCFFGAFVMGLITPKEGGFAEGIADRMELVTGVLVTGVCVCVCCYNKAVSCIKRIVRNNRCDM
jgi:Kef-type K+ transport system membrane component KefB